MIWRVLGAGVFMLGVAAGVVVPRSGPGSSGAPGAEEPVAPVAVQQAELDVLLDAVTGADPVVCELALLALGGRGYGWSSVRAEVEHIGAAAMSPQSSPQSIVKWVARPPRDPALVPSLEAALNHQDPCLRRTAARLLGRNGTDPAVDALLDALTSPDPAIRQSAAIGLGLAEKPSTSPALRRALSDDDAGVRAAAAWAVGELQDRESVTSLIRVLQGDTDRTVRRAAAWALGRIE